VSNLTQNDGKNGTGEFKIAHELGPPLIALHFGGKRNSLAELRKLPPISKKLLK
jgi:hypothetical protein